MKNIQSIQYHKVFNLGDYENEKISVELSVPQGEDPSTVIEDAKAWVMLHSTNGKRELEKAKAILSDPTMYRGIDVQNAEHIVKWSQRIKTLPASEVLEAN